MGGKQQQSIFGACFTLFFFFENFWGVFFLFFFDLFIARGEKVRRG